MCGIALDVENISIDKDCLDFLQDFLFKSTVDHHVACSRRAYLDFNRTLNFKEKKSQAERQELFDKGTEILRKSITNMMDAEISSQVEYHQFPSFKRQRAAQKAIYIGRI